MTTSFKNNKCDIKTRSYELNTFNKHNPFFRQNCLTQTFNHKQKSKWDNGNPCPRPLKSLKKLDDNPLNNTIEDT